MRVQQPTEKHREWFSSMQKGLKKEIIRSKAENRRLIRQWKHHPIKMILKLLSLVVSFAVTIAVILFIENAATAIGYGSIKDIIFIGQNKWASYGSDIAYILLFIVFEIIFLLLIEAGAAAFELRKEPKDKKTKDNSFAKEEIEKEKSDRRVEKNAISILVAISILLVLIFVGSVYTWTFNSTVFTDDKIIEKSVFKPSGAEYSYHDISKVEIDNKNDDANLFIDLYMKNGSVIKFDYTGGYMSDNDEYDEYPEAFVKNFANYLRDEYIPIIYNCTYEDVKQYCCDDECIGYLKDIFKKK